MHTIISKLSAGNSGIQVPPVLRAHGSPLIVLADLEGSIRTVSEPHISTGASRCHETAGVQWRIFSRGKNDINYIS